MAMAVLSSPPTRSHLSPSPSISTSHSSSTYTHHNRNPYPPSAISSRSKRNDGLLSLSVRASADNGAGFVTSSAAATTVNGVNASENSSVVTSKTKLKDNEDAGPKDESEVVVKKFADARWVSGNWDLKQFAKDGSTDWDAVIDAEARRRKWLEANPESSTNEDPVLFDSSIIPWWAWIKKFHLPEAELLNGRAAMVGFFMAYLVDSLTGVGLVDQMGNFFCKTLLFVSVLGVLLVRKNEDLDNLKKLLEETTFYDKQWQATWQEEPTKKD